MESGLHVSLPSTSFTCNTCGIRFIAADLQREHMKTSWHRYNLKRRVANLPLVTSDVFAHKVLQQERLASFRKPVDEFGFEIPQPKSKRTKGKKSHTRGRLPVIEKLSKDDGGDSDRDLSPAKSISSEFSQFSLGDNVSIVDDESNFDTGSELNYSEDDDDDDDEIDDYELNADQEELLDTDQSDEEYIDVLPITYCFYCNENNKTIENNLKHMFNKHGLYVPERSYLTDLQGLLTFLSEIIYIDNECYVCGFEGKNLESIRQHMISKGHCKIPFETDQERETIEEFYDFNIGNDQVDNNNGIKDGKKSHKLVTFDNNLVINGPKVIKSIDNDRKVLPTGLEVGHKDDLRYHHKPASSIIKVKDSEKLVILSDRRFSPGLTLRTVSKQEKLIRRFERKQINRGLNHHKVARDNNKNHFYDPNLGLKW